MKKNKIPLIIVGLAVISTLVLTYFYFDYKRSIDSPVSDNEELVEFTISEGQSTKDIAANLQDVGLVKNSFYFELYVRQNQLSQNLQAGDYTIPANITLEELAEILQIAYEQDVWVTIPEGIMMIEIADILEEEFSDVEEPVFLKDEFLSLAQTGDPVINAGMEIPAGKPCEGFLFPDTYRFAPDSNAQLVIDTLVSNFKIKVYDQYQEQIEQSQFNLYEIVTLASIIEREAKFEDDRPLVADILIRRLNAGWALEVDATLLYHFKDWEHEISSEDLALDTLYNTRLYQGFTPTPIANPGIDTIFSVLNPTPNDYWFYVSDEEGDLHYGKTLDEHNSNIQKYLSQ